MDSPKNRLSYFMIVHSAFADKFLNMLSTMIQRPDFRTFKIHTFLTVLAVALSFSNLQSQNTLWSFKDAPAQVLSSVNLAKYNAYKSDAEYDSVYLVKLNALAATQDQGRISIIVPGSSTTESFQVQRAEYESENQYIWQGGQIIDDSTKAPGYLLLLKANGELIGELSVGNQYFLIAPISDSLHVLIKTKSNIPDAYCGGPTTMDSVEAAPGATCTMGTDKCNIDILIMYVDSALFYIPDPLKATSIGTLGKWQIERMNTSFIRSNIKHRARLVGIFEWKDTWSYYKEAGEDVIQLSNKLKNSFSYVSQLRTILNADLVVLLTPGNNYSGVIGQAIDFGPVNFDNSGAVVGMPWTLNTAYVFTHEVGHLLGGEHEDQGVFTSYARAHEFDATVKGTLYHYYTIMHKSSNQLLNFSNPEVNYAGVATGTADRFNACRLQELGCSTGQILLSPECQIKVNDTLGCKEVRLSVFLQREDGTPCLGVASYWEFDYSYDGITYFPLNPAPTSSNKAVIPYSTTWCSDIVFVRIKAYNSSQVPIMSTFEWFERPCVCAPWIPEDGYRPVSSADKDAHIKVDNQIQLFPNPANEILTVDLKKTHFADGEVFVYIHDVAGRLLMESKTTLSALQTNIQLSNIPPGFHHIELRQDKNIVRSKFIKL